MGCIPFANFHFQMGVTVMGFAEDSGPYLWSIVTQISIPELIGETNCWVMNYILFLCKGLKVVLGGFFMSVYRIICMKKLDIAMNLRRQRRITNKLIGLEWITLGVLSTFFWTGVVLKGQTNFITCSSASGSEMIVVEFHCVIPVLAF